jgi:hypothetical protein
MLAKIHIDNAPVASDTLAPPEMSGVSGLEEAHVCK